MKGSVIHWADLYTVTVLTELPLLASQDAYCFTFCHVLTQRIFESQRPAISMLLVTNNILYRDADKSLARLTSRCILFDGGNISFDASHLIYIYI